MNLLNFENMVFDAHERMGFNEWSIKCEFWNYAIFWSKRTTSISFMVFWIFIIHDFWKCQHMTGFQWVEYQVQFSWFLKFLEIHSHDKVHLNMWSINCEFWNCAIFWFKKITSNLTMVFWIFIIINVYFVQVWIFQTLTSFINRTTSGLSSMNF